MNLGWLARMLLRRASWGLSPLAAAFLAVIVLVLMGVRADAAEGPRQQVETVCTGGAAYTAAGQDGTGRQIRNAGERMTCPAPADGRVIRLYGTVTTASRTLRVTAADGQTWDQTYVHTALVHQRLLWTSPAGVVGPFTVDFVAGSGSLTDFYTVDDQVGVPPPGEPTPTPTPTDTAPPPPGGEPTPTPTPTQTVPPPPPVEPTPTPTPTEIELPPPGEPTPTPTPSRTASPPPASPPSPPPEYAEGEVSLLPVVGFLGGLIVPLGAWQIGAAALEKAGR